MRRLVLALALAAPAALAQPALVSEASVDQEAYAAGETITLRYTVRNGGDEGTTVWLQCPDPRVTFDTLTSPGDGVFCVGPIDPDDGAVPVGAWSAVTWVWRLDPDSLGVPERGGAQTITVGVDARCGADYETAERCALAGSASFTAPAAASGPLRVEYDPADADSVRALRSAYRATVTDSTARPGRVSERWVVRAVPLSATAAALDTNGVVREAYVERTVSPDERFATSVGGPPRPSALTVTAPSPNPAGASASFTVRPARTGRVTVDVLDALGRRVAALHDGPFAGGADHRFVLATGSLPAGVYVVRVIGEGTRVARRLVVR